MASAADGNIGNAGRVTADVERGDGVGSRDKTRLDVEDTAPAPDSVIKDTTMNC